MDGALDISPPRDGTARTPGWTGHLIAKVARPLARRKRVIVGSERGAQALGRKLFRRWRVADGSGSVVLDAHRIDGQLMECVRREAPDEVYFDLGAGLDEYVVTRVGAGLLMDGVGVHLVLPHAGRPPVHAETASVGTHAVISLHAVARTGIFGRVLWRLLDVVGAALLLVLLAPLMAAVAGLVWWKMGRPVLDRQRRIGQGGRLFALYKFSSVIPGTPLRRLLRRTSLDELPQLWNVLRGDMSLVGPRAIGPEEVGEYGGHARRLLRIRPGLTRRWPLSGRSRTGYPERARMGRPDLGEQSVRKDLQILLRTLPAVLRQRGAL